MKKRIETRYVVVLDSGPIEGLDLKEVREQTERVSWRMFKAKRIVVKTLWTEECLMYSRSSKEYHVVVAE